MPEEFTLKNPPVRGLAYDNALHTPPWFFDLVDRDFGPFDLDICASEENALCERFFTADTDCLASTWGNAEKPSRAICNPPYEEGLIGPIVAQALTEALAGRCSTLFLFPAKKSEQRWYHELVLNQRGPGASAIMPVGPGRIDFWRDGQPLGNPNHASVLVDFVIHNVGANERWWYKLPASLSYHRTRGLKGGGKQI